MRSCHIKNQNSKKVNREGVITDNNIKTKKKKEKKTSSMGETSLPKNKRKGRISLTSERSNVSRS